MKKTTRTMVLIILITILGVFFSVYVSLNWSIRIGLSNPNRYGTYGYFGTNGWPNAEQIFDIGILESVEEISNTGLFKSQFRSPNVFFILCASLLNTFIHWNKLAIVLTSISFYLLTVGLLFFMGYKYYSSKELIFILLTYVSTPIFVKNIWTGFPFYSTAFATLLFYFVFFIKEKKFEDKTFFLISIRYLSVVLLMLSDLFLFPIILTISLFIWKIRIHSDDEIDNKHLYSLLLASIITITYILLLIYALDINYLSNIQIKTESYNIDGVIDITPKNLKSFLHAFFISQNLFLLFTFSFIYSFRNFFDDQLKFLTILYLAKLIQIIIFSSEFNVSSFAFCSFLLLLISLDIIHKLDNLYGGKKEYKNVVLSFFIFVILLNLIILIFISNISLFNRILEFDIST